MSRLWRSAPLQRTDLKPLMREKVLQDLSRLVWYPRLDDHDNNRLG